MVTIIEIYSVKPPHRAASRDEHDRAGACAAWGKDLIAQPRMQLLIQLSV
jgi:hypothetical protein